MRLTACEYEISTTAPLLSFFRILCKIHLSDVEKRSMEHEIRGFYGLYIEGPLGPLRLGGLTSRGVPVYVRQYHNSQSYCYNTPLSLSVLPDTTWHRPAELPIFAAIATSIRRFSIGVDPLRISLTRFYIDGNKYLGLVRQQKIFCLEYYVRGDQWML